MLRVAVISDTHGDLRNLDQAKARLGHVDWLIHAGDFIRDAAPCAARLGLAPDRVRAVVGNCDHQLAEPVLDLFALDGVPFLLTHGHHYGVKHTLDRLFFKAQESGVRVAIFGHSHIAVSADDRGVLLFNPGSLSQPRLPHEGASCGLLEVSGGQVKAQILQLHG